MTGIAPSGRAPSPFSRLGPRLLGVAAVLGFAFVSSCSGEPPGTEPIAKSESALSSGLVIAEVYGGGGNAGPPVALYTNDYVVLFNRGSAAVSLNGLYLQYGSATGTFNYNPDSGTNLIVTLPNVSVPAGGYFLIQLSGGTNGAALPTPDATGSIAMSATAGKVALVTQPLNGCGTTATQCPTTNIVDLVGYGSTAQQYEGSAAAPAPSNILAVQRKAGGCTETDQNSTDFEAVTPTPKNSATAPAPCGATDAGGDAPADVSTDAPADVATDTAADTGTDAAADTGSDTGPIDAGPPPVGLVVAELYGGSGNNAPFKNDYVVIFNRGSAAASLANVYLQYASATGNFNATSLTNTLALPTATLQPGQYFLVQVSEGPITDGSVGATLPTPDVTGTTNLSLSAGKVALAFPKPLDACGTTATQCPTTKILDLVGYGSTAQQYEGTGPAPAASIQNAAIRKQGGCQDTNVNADDFLAASPTPKNTSSPLNNCALLPDSGTGGSGGTGATAGTGGATGGTGGAATGGTGGAATGGTGGAATGGTAGAATGGATTGGAGGAATGGAGGSGAKAGSGGLLDSGLDGGNNAFNAGSDSGCGCETPGGSKPAGFGAWLVALGFVLVARRRRRA